MSAVQSSLHMQRMYSMFPHGLPGIGLLLLRVAAATEFLLATGSLYCEADYLAYAGRLALTLFLLLGTALPVLACACCGWLFWTRLLPSHFHEWLPSTMVGLQLSALACLGPGGLSIDGLLFGRKKIAFDTGQVNDLPAPTSQESPGGPQ